jgi:hypothetical protein
MANPDLSRFTPHTTSEQLPHAEILCTVYPIEVRPEPKTIFLTDQQQEGVDPGLIVIVSPSVGWNNVTPLDECYPFLLWDGYLYELSANNHRHQALHKAGIGLRSRIDPPKTEHGYFWMRDTSEGKDLSRALSPEVRNAIDATIAEWKATPPEV